MIVSNEKIAVNMVKKHHDKPIYWGVVIFLITFHLIGIYTILFYPITKVTFWQTMLTWFYGGLSITVGYHRLWSHNSFKAHPIVRLVLAIGGAVAYQGSIKWWVLRHRLHHRYTDTEHDPYDATRGFWFSHMGWLFEKPIYTRMKWIDKSDLDADKIVLWQHKYFKFLALLFGIVMPALTGFIAGDTIGGLLYGGFVAHIIIWHTTWFINSLAHSWGEQEFSTENTSRGNLLLALLTMGEGHHNFHHEFPRDYRNGVRYDDYDPSKWLIAILEYFGATNSLIRVPDDVINKARVGAAQSKIDNWNKTLVWSDENSLPVWTKLEFEKESENFGDLIIINNFALDISKFKYQHPGGEKLLANYVGKDATKAFFGVLNNHTKSARQMMLDMRVAKVSSEVEESILCKKDV